MDHVQDLMPSEGLSGKHTRRAGDIKCNLKELSKDKCKYSMIILHIGVRWEHGQIDVSPPFFKEFLLSFWTASKRFWTTVQCLRKGKQCTVNNVYGGNGLLLTSTE